MMTQTFSPRRGQRLAGIVLIVAGGTFFLDQSGIVDVWDLWHYWPLLLIVIGAQRMLDARSARVVTSGLWSVVIGAWLMVNQAGWWGSDFHNSWPGLLIAWGVTLLLYPRIARRFPIRGSHDDAVRKEQENGR